MVKVIFAALLSIALFSSVFCDNSTDVEDKDIKDKTEPKKYDRSPINCYACSSPRGGDCYDPIDESKVETKTCPSGICLKYIQKIGEDDLEMIKRDCAEEVEPLLYEKKQEEGCVLSTGTKKVQTQLCNCLTDKCNGVAEMTSTTSIVLAASALGFLMTRVMQ